ncbi:MAG: Gfo/Idh/MocA family oxidoreductase [Nocardioidaceae bacterium]
MRVLVIGAGRMGAIRVADLVGDPRVSEVVVANRTDARGAALADRTGARHVAWSDLGGVRQDATVVALATAAHADLLHQVLATGRPVLCEKPIALGLAETLDVIAVAERCGSTVQVGFQRRHDPGIRELHDRIVDGRLGTVYSLRLLSHDVAPSTVEFAAASGGIFRDLHVHDLDLVRWLTGSPVETVFATTAVRAHPQYEALGDADVSLVHAVTASGVQVSVHGARHDAVGHDVRVEAFGSLDSVAAGVTDRTPLRALDAGGAVPTDPYAGFVDRFRTAFARETAAFVDLVVDGGPSPCPPQEALESLRAAIACERSVALGSPVRVADVTASDPDGGRS